METRGQHERFEAAAEGFDRATRRRVRRSVARGEPVQDPALVGLSRAYLEKLERVAADNPPPWLWIAYVVLGLYWAAMSGSQWSGWDFRSIGDLCAAATWLGLAARLRLSKKPPTPPAGLLRSKAILNGAEDLT